MANRPSIRSAQCNDTYFPILDGVVRTVHNYAAVLNRRSGAYVVCPKQKGNYDDSTLPYKVLRCASLRLPVMNYALAFPVDPAAVHRITAMGRTDIVHIHSPFMVGTTALAAARKLGIPAVATFHSKYYSDVLQVTKSRALARMVTDAIVGFYNLCDEVWACSEGTAETLRSYGYKKKIPVMPNGCDMTEPENIAGLRGRAVQEFSLQEKRCTLLFTGSLIWQKNLKLILDTFRILCRVRPGRYRLILAGTGNHENEIRAYAEKLDFPAGSVLFTGGIHDRDLLAGLYSFADLFFFPSVYDNAPLVVREAAALRTPSLLTAGSNAAEAVSPGINGFTAEENAKDMAKTILRITSDPETLREAGQRAAETIPVPWEQILSNVYDRYEEILGRKRKRSVRQTDPA